MPSPKESGVGLGPSILSGDLFCQDIPPILNCHNILHVDVFVGDGDHRDYSLCHLDQKSVKTLKESVGEAQRAQLDGAEVTRITWVLGSEGKWVPSDSWENRIYFYSWVWT